jgi:hypothetical protein
MLTNMNPAQRKTRLAAIDAQIRGHQDAVKALKAKRAKFADAVPVTAAADDTADDTADN